MKLYLGQGDLGDHSRSIGSRSEGGLCGHGVSRPGHDGLATSPPIKSSVNSDVLVSREVTTRRRSNEDEIRWGSGEVGGGGG